MSQYNNAGTADANAYNLPLHYGDRVAEYRAICEGTGIIDRSGRGKVRTTGGDRMRFLHGMVTNTVTGLAEGAGNYAAITDVRGNALTDVWIHNVGDALWLETEPGYGKKLCEILNRYLIADDVTLFDETDAYGIIGVQGPGAPDALSRILYEVPGDMPEHHTTRRIFNGIPVWITARSLFGLPGYDVRIASDTLPALWNALADAGGTPVGWQAAEALRIEAGVPRYGADVDESVTPLEAGLLHAIDFNKGCYIGQEVIAKMQFRGKPRRYLVKLQIAGQTPPAVGTEFRVGDQVVGHVTSSAFSPGRSGPVALARVRRGFHEPGQQVALPDGAATISDLSAR